MQVRTRPIRDGLNAVIGGLLTREFGLLVVNFRARYVAKRDSTWTVIKVPPVNGWITVPFPF